MGIKELTSKIIKKGKNYYTLSKMPSFKVYGEKTFFYKGKEYRQWDPSKSKLCAALHKGMPLTYLKEMEKFKSLLYLGIANGTTASHIEDINPTGIIYGVEYSIRSIIDLAYMREKRKSNIIPILESASQPHKYLFMVSDVDMLYVDIAQPHQTEIAIRNADMFLKDGGVMFIAIKTRSIDVKRKPKEIVMSEIEKIKEKNFKILYHTMLDPYEKDHGFVVSKKV